MVDALAAKLGFNIEYFMSESYISGRLLPTREFSELLKWLGISIENPNTGVWNIVKNRCPHNDLVPGFMKEFYDLKDKVEKLENKLKKEN